MMNLAIKIKSLYYLHVSISSINIKHRPSNDYAQITIITKKNLINIIAIQLQQTNNFNYSTLINIIALKQL